MNKTDISWASYVWNPVTGCTKVSQGCAHCYAEGIAKRFWGERKFTDVICHEDRLDQPLHIKKAGRVFVNSMSDLFHKDVPDEFINQVFAYMRAAEKHTFIILTKRPERMKEYLQAPNRSQEIQKYFTAMRFSGYIPTPDSIDYVPLKDYPLDNVWLGVSVEDQKTADERIPLLLQTPAAKRFVSYEPALEKVSLSYPLNGCPVPEGDGTREQDWVQTCPPLDWVIMGCESGPNRRPMDIDWARSMRDQCQAAKVPFFLKQSTENKKLIKMPFLDGKQWKEFPDDK
jgi:protein gp37